MRHRPPKRRRLELQAMRARTYALELLRDMDDKQNPQHSKCRISIMTAEEFPVGTPSKPGANLFRRRAGSAPAAPRRDWPKETQWPLAPKWK